MKALRELLEAIRPSLASAKPLEEAGKDPSLESIRRYRLAMEKDLQALKVELDAADI
jgi:hypothetical protein